MNRLKLGRARGPQREAWGTVEPEVRHFEVFFVGQPTTPARIQEALIEGFVRTSERWDQVEVIDLPDEEAHLA